MSLLPATTIRSAIDTLYVGFVTGARIYPDEWDRAVMTLCAARTQYGGTPRQLIARLFLSAGSNESADVAGIIAALIDHLDTHAPPPEPSGDRGPTDGLTADGTSETPDEPGPGHQIRFFEP